MEETPGIQKGLLTIEGVWGGREWGSGVLKGAQKRQNETMQTNTSKRYSGWHL